MPKITPEDLRNYTAGEAPAVVEALLPLATGLNKDGTPFSLSTSQDMVSSGAVVVGTPANNGETVVVPVSGYGSVAIDLQPSASIGAVIAFEASFDGGTAWRAIQGASVGAVGTLATSHTFASSAAATYEFSMPSLATHFRARLTTNVSGGTLTVRAQAGAQFNEPVVGVSGSVNLSSGNNRVGFVATAGVWVQETISATLAAAAVANGGGRDVFGTTGSATNGSNHAVAEFRALSTLDVAHTLAIEVSDDNTTWDRVGEQGATLRGGKYTANVEIKPVTRYCRGVVVNGPAAATFARLRTAQIA